MHTSVCGACPTWPLLGHNLSLWEEYELSQHLPGIKPTSRLVLSLTPDSVSTGQITNPCPPGPTALGPTVVSSHCLLKNFQEASVKIRSHLYPQNLQIALLHQKKQHWMWSPYFAKCNSLPCSNVLDLGQLVPKHLSKLTLKSQTFSDVGNHFSHFHSGRRDLSFLIFMGYHINFSSV